MDRADLIDEMGNEGLRRDDKLEIEYTQTCELKIIV